MSSNALDPKTLIDILFEAYLPVAYPRTIEHGRANNAAWIVMFDARKAADGFFLTPSSNTEEKNRVWASPQQASQALAMNEPLFTAFAKACSLLPSTAVAPAGKNLPDKSDIVDVLTTELGTVSLEALAQDFQLTVAYRNRDVTGQIERRRKVVSVPIMGKDLATGIASGLSPLRAACDLAPQTIQLLFGQDQALDAKSVRELMQRDIQKATGSVSGGPKKQIGL